VIIAVKEVGGIGALFDALGARNGEAFTSAWEGTGPGGANAFGDVFGIVVGLGFCLSFGYWTTNFAEVQRAMAAKSTNAARMTPIIGAYPKVFIPLITILPGMCALVLIPGLGEPGGVEYNNAIPALMDAYLPAGALGVAVTGLVAAFMAGMAANVSSVNAVFTYDLWEEYVRPGRSDAYYLWVGRLATVAGVVIGIGTAFIAANFENISHYFQVLFTFFNVPLFVTFIIGMFWKRATAGAGFWGILVGTLGALGTYVFYKFIPVLEFRSDLHESFWGGIVAFVLGAATIVLVSMRQQPKTDDELRGLVRGLELRDMQEGELAFYRRPVPMGVGSLVIAAALYVGMSLL